MMACHQVRPIEMSDDPAGALISVTVKTLHEREWQPTGPDSGTKAIRPPEHGVVVPPPCPVLLGTEIEVLVTPRVAIF